MTESVGILPVPVTATAREQADHVVGDPVRLRLGEFLQAAIRAGCQSAWEAIGGGTNVCERVEVNDPSDNTFSTTKLPALFIYRESGGRLWEHLSADFSYRTSILTALWVPPTAVQEWKARRESFFQAVESAVMSAVANGRTPGWVLTGDTDPIAATEGSEITSALGIRYPLYHGGVTFDDLPLTIEMRDGNTKTFPGLKISFKVQEMLTLGPRGPIYPSALDLELTNSADEVLGDIEEDLPA